MPIVLSDFILSTVFSPLFLGAQHITHKSSKPATQVCCEVMFAHTSFPGMGTNAKFHIYDMICYDLPVCMWPVMAVLFFRYPVHKPSRPRLEPASVQLDRQEGGSIREGQPDHTVWQVPPYLPGHPQIKVWQIPSSSLSLWHVTLTVMLSWRRMLGCDITWEGGCAKVGVLDRSKQGLTQKNWMLSCILLYRTTRLLQHLHHHCHWSRQQQQEAEEGDSEEEYFVLSVKPNFEKCTTVPQLINLSSSLLKANIIEFCLVKWSDSSSFISFKISWC